MTMNQWVREGKAWKRGRSVVCMGFRRSYVPQKSEARWGSPPAVRAVCLRCSDVGVWEGGGEAARLWCARGGECFSARWRSEPAQGQRLSQGEKRKRKASVAAVYSIERQVRTPGSNPGRGRPVGGAPQVRVRHERVWASVERSPNR